MQLKAAVDLCGGGQAGSPRAAFERHGSTNQTAFPASPSFHKSKQPRAARYIAVRVRKRYAVPPRCIFNAWLDPEVAGKWLFATASQPMADVTIDGRVGGSFCFVERRAGETSSYIGRYVDIVPDSRLVFTLSMEPDPDVVTRVTVAIASMAKGCALELIHENIPRAHASYVEGRWTGILYGLSVTLDPIGGCAPFEVKSKHQAAKAAVPLPNAY